MKYNKEIVLQDLIDLERLEGFVDSKYDDNDAPIDYLRTLYYLMRGYIKQYDIGIELHDIDEDDVSILNDNCQSLKYLIELRLKKIILTE